MTTGRVRNFQQFMEATHAPQWSPVCRLVHHPRPLRGVGPRPTTDEPRLDGAAAPRGAWCRTGPNAADKLRREEEHQEEDSGASNQEDQVDNRNTYNSPDNNLQQNAWVSTCPSPTTACHLSITHPWFSGDLSITHDLGHRTFFWKKKFQKTARSDVYQFNPSCVAGLRNPSCVAGLRPATQEGLPSEGRGLPRLACGPATGVVRPC